MGYSKEGLFKNKTHSKRNKLTRKQIGQMVVLKVLANEDDINNQNGYAPKQNRNCMI